MSQQRQRELTQRPASGDGSGPEALLSWYDANARTFPWRRDGDPYRVLVSEVMLQQTRTEVVERRFPEFLEQFPNLAALASAREDEVVAAWSGLGYYRRARSLHACAVSIHHRGSWPRTAAELKQLPGIGDYTAAAVASIAFGEAVVVVDGNVKRLAARLTAETGEPSRAAVLERLRREAEKWLDPARPGDSNQALMELGSTVCKPRPLCDRCPLTGACRALAGGEPEAYPKTKPAKAQQQHRWWLVVLRDGDRVWLARRSVAEAWLPGTYELPWVDVDAETIPAAQAIGERYGLALRLDERLGEVRHAIGRRDIRAEVWSASPLRAESAAEVAEAAADGLWADRVKRTELATGSLVAKALELTNGL